MIHTAPNPYIFSEYHGKTYQKTSKKYIVYEDDNIIQMHNTIIIVLFHEW